MSDFMHALTPELTGRPYIGPNSELGDIVKELIHAAGTIKNAAAMLGVSSTTFSRWRNYAEGRERGVKQKPKTSTKAMVAAIRRAQLNAGKEAEIRNQRINIVIDADARVSETTVRQKIHLKSCEDRGRLATSMPNDAIGEVMDLWLEGEDALADETLGEIISDYYVDGMEVEIVHNISFEH